MGVSSFRILVRNGPESGKSFPLPAEGVVRVGSARPSQIVIAAQGVLPVHFFLKCAGGRVALIVQDESAKVLLNGANVRKKLLEAGDAIQVGDAVLVLEGVERDPLLGHTLGGYRIDAFIGSGAMGTVYKATQLSLDRTVALKILSPELTRDAAFVSKFLEEAKAAAKLNHPHVVQVYDAAAAPSPIPVGRGQAPDGANGAQVFFFSMEHMPGGTLQKLIDKEGKVSLEKALAIGCDTARALVWAEEHGIVHRDIKPANLLFAADGSVKVADLGIAADVDRMMEGVEGLQGAGSPRYMAPEQAQRKGVDHRADIYALGSTLFRAISGRHVFEGKTATDVIKAKTTEDPPRLDAAAPEVPSDVADVIGKMLSRELSGRPRTCGEALAALEECLASAQEEAAVVTGDDEAATHTTARGVRNRTKHRGRARDAEAEGGWNEFVASTAGKVSLSVSSMLILLALIWPLSTSSPDPSAGSPAVTGAQPGGTQRVHEPATFVDKTTVGGDTEPKVSPRHVEKSGQSPDSPSPGDNVLRELSGILQEYRTGLIEPKRAVAALEDFKRKHPEPMYADRAETSLAQIRDSLLEACKNALTRLVNGDLKALLEQGDFREAIGRLVKLGELHPFCIKEINAEVVKVEDDARAALKKAEDEADKAVSLGDFASAIATLKKVEPTLPANIQTAATERIASLTKDAKEYAELSGPFGAQVEGVQDSIAALDFAKAASQAAALPHPTNTVLAKRRAAIVGEVERCRAAWDALSAAAARAGAKTDPKAILESAPKDMLAMLGASPTAEQIEGLGLLLLHSQGPDRARDLLLDSRLGPQKSALYKVRLAEEEEAYLSRYARKMMARMDGLKSAAGGGQADWPGLVAEILRKITSSRSTSSYEKAKSDLAKAYLRAKAEVLRAAVPGSLFKGKVKSYKPDGSIELLYDFKTEEDFKDFVSMRSSSSRLEREEKMAKVRGEIRLGRGDVFKNRIGVIGRLPANGFSPQSPNINVALWTRDDDRVSPGQKGEGAAGEPGAPRDYFAFGLGYKARLPSGGATDAVTVKGGGASVPMPANAIFGGVRGEALRGSSEGDCFWAKPGGKFSGPQTFHLAMASGALTWTINTRQLLTARDLKDLEVLFKRDEPYTGSVTFFTNADVLYYDSIIVEGELNPAWVEEQLISLAEAELKKVEPDYPFRN